MIGHGLATVNNFNDLYTYVESCNTNKKSLDEYKKQYQRELSLTRKGLSLASISAITCASINTIAKLLQLVKEDKMQIGLNA